MEKKTENDFFGKKLKEFRLKYGKIGLRNFAKKIGLNPSELSEIERGMTPPPSCDLWLHNIVEAIGLKQDSSESKELYNSWKQQFVMQEISDDVVISPFVHKKDGIPLTEEEYKKVNKYINDIGRKHNKKAREYNKEHGKNII
jgi:transcriptional regulator with XRE-family HTH domain